MNEKRHRKIIATSILGILANLLLAVAKVIVGLLSHSIAIVLDAVNNFSDMLSSVVTIIGSVFSHRLPDRKHPMGHGRSEYLSAAIIGILILYIGFTALIESVKKIITPETPNYSTATLIIVALAIIVKIILGFYVKYVGKKVDSAALVASGTDAHYDVIISIGTLVAAIIFITTGLDIEAYIALLISLFIMNSGFKILRETFSQILGERVDVKLARRIKDEIKQLDHVKGAFDLAVHDYGPDTTFASVNIEVLDTMTASEIDDLSRLIRKTIYRKCKVIITSVGVYSINTRDPEINRLYKSVKKLVLDYPGVIGMHGFSVDQKEHEIDLDVVLDFSVKNRRVEYQKIVHALKESFPNYTFEVSLDSDFSD